VTSGVVLPDGAGMLLAHEAHGADAHQTPARHTSNDRLYLQGANWNAVTAPLFAYGPPKGDKIIQSLVELQRINSTMTYAGGKTALTTIMRALGPVVSDSKRFELNI
jgi:hypothetical protein